MFRAPDPEFNPRLRCLYRCHMPLLVSKLIPNQSNRSNQSNGSTITAAIKDCYFAFGGAEDVPSQTALAGPGESSNESAGETLDVEGFGDAGNTFGGGLGAGLGLGAMAGGAQPSAGGPGASAAGVASTRGSRGIGIGLGVAAGAATAHRGMKRELSDSNIAGAGGGARSGPSLEGDMSRRSMSEQQKLERRVSEGASGVAAWFWVCGRGRGAMKTRGSGLC